MASGDVVRLVNVGDTDFVDAFNGRSFRIPAGGQLMVDFDAMCLWLGHPDANNFDPRNRVRVYEYDRLRTRYGVDAAGLKNSLDEVAFDSEELFRRMRPQLEAYDMAEQRIYTVADDPNGDLLAPVAATATPSGDMSVILARLQSMEQEQANLRQQLAMAQRREQALNDAQPVDPDAPRPVSQDQGIPGTVAQKEDPYKVPSTAPRAPAVSDPGEDAPTRIRVTQT
jgi:hypothetical protein